MRLETRHFGSSACCDRAALLALRRDIFKLGEDSKVSLVSRLVSILWTWHIFNLRMLSSLHHPITKKMGTKKATTTTGSLKLEVPTAIRWFVSYLPSSSGRVLGCHPENRKVSNSYDYLRARDRLRQVFKEQSEQSLPFLSMGNNHRGMIGGRKWAGPFGTFAQSCFQIFCCCKKHRSCMGTRNLALRT